MGSRGPVPKRSTAKAGHRTKAERPDKVTASGEVAVPEAGEDWHPIAREWFESLASSGQSRYFEPSDWQHARYVAEAISRNLKAGRFSGQLFAAVTAAMGELGSTEGARRRMRIEVEREVAAPTGSDAEVAVMERYRKAAEGG